MLSYGCTDADKSLRVQELSAPMHERVARHTRGCSQPLSRLRVS
jgi:hypothetical protein